MPFVEHLQSLTLDLPPSCVEFWPLNPQYAVVGMYNLEKPEAEQEESKSSEASVEREKKIQQRNGSIILLQVIGDDVNIIHTLPTRSAILDIHFCPSRYPLSRFGVATSTGSIGLYALADGNGKEIREEINSKGYVLQLTHLETCQLWGEDLIVTSFAFHPTKDLVACTLHDGRVVIAELEHWQGMNLGTVIIHELEAWALSFTADGSALYSGGDDSALKCRVLPTKSDELFYDGSSGVPPAFIGWADQKIHGAGVTAILPLQTDYQDSLVITGSYDDHIRLIYSPLSSQRRVLSEMNLGGGVWRLKRLDNIEASSSGEGETVVALLQASCMYAGARILKLIRTQDDNWRFEVVAKFEEHKSMNYGSDCQPSLNAKGQRTFITTSFYDRLLCLWRY
ncbi:hypothetical protein K469DRAFT_736744 [Zopfia rhizophila CBS 207.26]|uniref:methylated diphthine methylhydrolase n=1 Tax=Zopfia rhizophila CBS 207.26 TaxID=1314779 RepID=A0A6A6EG27_9PEZI|nr:hypothetical protein K469DRAFT_736744 [Zopfia rhizophila CBS 207.26]